MIYVILDSPYEFFCLKSQLIPYIIEKLEWNISVFLDEVDGKQILIFRDMITQKNIDVNEDEVNQIVNSYKKGYVRLNVQCVLDIDEPVKIGKYTIVSERGSFYVKMNPKEDYMMNTQKITEKAKFTFSTVQV